LEFTRGIWTAEGKEFFPIIHPATWCCLVEATDNTVKKSNRKTGAGQLLFR